MVPRAGWSARALRDIGMALATTMLKITTWNVNGIRARERELLRWLETERPDVVCLQELKAAPEQLPATLVELPDYVCYWHGHKGYSGVALHLARKTFPNGARFSHPEFDHETRIVTARAGDIVFASIYVPNGGKDFPAKVRFLDALHEFAAAAQRDGVRLVLCGDLNVAREQRDVHPKLQDAAQIGQTPAERAQLERILSCGLVDLSRKFHPDDDQLFTWWAPWRQQRERNIGWRLDYMLVSSSLATTATACNAFREYGTSDHAPLLTSFDIPPPQVEPNASGGQRASTRPQLELF
jgi:exodeoxyribonuclease-3